MSLISLHTIFFLHLAATLFMMGVIWFVQLVHYPLLREIDGYRESAYEFTHLRRATWVFAPPMVLETATAVWLFWKEPDFMRIELHWLGLALLAVIWLVTLFQATKHQILASAFDEDTHRKLVRSNLLRSVAWSLRAGLVLYILAGLCL